MKIDTKADKEAIDKLNLKLQIYKRQNVIIDVDKGVKFVCSVIGSSSYISLADSTHKCTTD